MASLRLENISKWYQKGAPALDALNLLVEDGEFLVLVGPSGCGKSTTLRIIAGLEEPTQGTVFIGDTDVTSLLPKDRDIAMVFQNYALYPHMTVYENMAFGLKLRRLSTGEIDERVREASQMLEIAQLLMRKPKELSGGERQRVALGRAIVRKPNLFLFDEPLSNLDAKLRVQMRTEIKKLHTRLKTTMIYVTHDQVEAMTMGERIVVMRNGIIHQNDTPLTVYNNPADLFVAGFIGSPAMNLLPVLIRTDPLRASDGMVDINLSPVHQELLAGRIDTEVMLGIRPEHLHVRNGGDGTRAQLRVRHEVSELMGNEMYLYLHTGRNPLVCRSSTVETNLIPGEEILVYVDPEKIHFFDIESHRALERAKVSGSDGGGHTTSTSETVL